MKNSTLPNAVAVKQSQEHFKSHIIFFCILHLLETDIFFEDIAVFITNVRIVPPLGIPVKITV